MDQTFVSLFIFRCFNSHSNGVWEATVVPLCLLCYTHVLIIIYRHIAYLIYRRVEYWCFPASSFQYLCFSRCFIPLSEHYALCEGDVNGIVIGSGTNIQDNSLVHVAKSNLTGKVLPTVIGDNVTVGEWMWWIIISWMT